MTTPTPSPTPISTVNLSFPRRWQAEILPRRPLILPPRHFIYPRHAEEVERGALEILIRPHAPLEPGAPGLSFEKMCIRDSLSSVLNLGKTGGKAAPQTP